MECLKESGKVADDSDKLTIFVMTGARRKTHCFRMDVGIGSSWHCLLADC